MTDEPPRLMEADEVLEATGAPDAKALRRLARRGDFPEPYGMIRWVRSEVEALLAAGWRFRPSMLPRVPPGTHSMTTYDRDKAHRLARHRPPRPREVGRKELCWALGVAYGGTPMKTAQRLMERAGLPLPASGRGWDPEALAAWLRAGPPADCHPRTLPWLRPAMQRALDRLGLGNSAPSDAETATESGRSQEQATECDR